MKRIAIIVVLLVLAMGGGGIWYYYAQASSVTTFKTEEVARGKLVATISSTGTLQAKECVDVGAQVQGRIIKIGEDKYTQSGIIDWGSEVQGPVVDTDGTVKPGTILAQIDPSLYEAQRNSARASVLSAKANVMSAQADVKVKTATLKQATRDWARAETLVKTGGIQQAEHDQYEAAFESAGANLEVSKALLEVAKAQVEVTEANLKNAQTNLDYCTISAPVSGKVVDRRVNMGQTVVASLSTPSLFLIAKDLKKMEVWATVNEVDVDKIKGGQDVDYTVDSRPGLVYHGKVVPQGKLPYRLNATMNQNVVTYTVVVSVENEDEALKPYMTTNLSFIVMNKENALLVPNAALRWQPTKLQIAPEQRDSYAAMKSKKPSPTDADAQNQGVIWVEGADGFVHYTQVRTGMNDGARTEIVGVIGAGDVPEHTKVIVGERKANASSDVSNPFGVKMFQSNKQKE